MSKTLSFKGRQKPYLVVEMEDGEKLLVKPPSKAMMDNLVNLAQADGSDELEMLDRMYGAATDILNHNMNGKKYSKKDIDDAFDIDDVYILFKTYVDFVTEMQSQKN